VNFTIPIFEPIASQYYVRLVAQDWLHAEAFGELDLHDLVLPEMTAPHTDLLDLEPLPRSALKHEEFEKMYEGRFSHFNPIQTQAFYTLYHTDESVLLGAPTGEHWLS
jgi:activating signal cointegrator complex subunit 3